MVSGKDSSNMLMADNLPKIVCEGFNQIIDFLNGSSIKYALTVNPNIYVSCIKQFWTTVVVKKVNDVTRLQALVYMKKLVVTEASIRDALRLDDAEGIECLPNEEIFAVLARMGYEKPSTKRTLWNEFSSSMASAVICLSSGKGFFGVETPLFKGMIVEKQVAEGADEVHDEGVPAASVVTKGDVIAAKMLFLVLMKNHLFHPLHHLLHHHNHLKISLQLLKYTLLHLTHLKFNHNHLNLNHNRMLESL
nr:xylulose kinase-1 [Tanacetum cinerariifolium]